MMATLLKLIEGGSSGVFRCHTALPHVKLQAVGQHGLRLAQIGLATAHDKNAFLRAVASGLAFPEYFGHNWDAFYDCLTELTEEQGNGIVLLLRDASGFARAEPEEFAAAVDALQDAAEYWEEKGKMLLVIVELEAPVLAPELTEINAPPA
jgi:RNAse (barnase) inhibitor barstar